jgi:hypothetical protein
MTTTCKELDANKIILSLELMGESKAHLLTFICACGFDNDHKEYKRVDFLIKQRGDLTEWIKLFNGDIDSITETTDKFKERKIKKLNIGKDEFIVSSIKSLKNGLQEFFQVECSELEITKINAKLHSKELNLEFIYNRSKEDNWYNTAGKFARSNWKVTA